MDCLQHVRSSGPSVIVCKSCATHWALITCNMSCYVPRGKKGQLSFLSLTEFKWHLFELYSIGWTINTFSPAPDKLLGATELPSAPTPNKLSGVLATFVLASFCFNGMHIYWANGRYSIPTFLYDLCVSIQAFGVFLASVFANFLSCNEQASVEKCEASWKKGFPWWKQRLKQRLWPRCGRFGFDREWHFIS